MVSCKSPRGRGENHQNLDHFLLVIDNTIGWVGSVGVEYRGKGGSHPLVPVLIYTQLVEMKSPI